MTELLQTAVESYAADAQTVGRLAELARRLDERKESVLSLWAALYATDAARTLDEPSFRTSFGGELASVLEPLRSRDLAHLVGYLKGRGRELAAGGVPFAEVIRTLELFEDCCQKVLATSDPIAALADQQALDRLCHLRMGVLAGAYLERVEEEHRSAEAALERDVASLHDLLGREDFAGLVGRSRPMQLVYRRLERAATAVPGGMRPRDVLLVGEPGTGKQLAARAIHLRAGRRDTPFHHYRGSDLPTTATPPPPWRATTAGGGTLYVEEITEAAPAAQALLLESADDRVLVASTSRDPEASVEKGTLRRDLFLRLRKNRIDLPPLRARLEDIPLLARAILTRAGLPRTVVTPAVLERLTQRPWPGNVRELEGVLLQAAAVAPHGQIRVADLPRHGAGDGAGAMPLGDGSVLPTLREAETALVRRALGAAHGNKLRAARALGVSRKWLYARLRDLTEEESLDGRCTGARRKEGAS